MSRPRRILEKEYIDELDRQVLNKVDEVMKKYGDKNEMCQALSEVAFKLLEISAKCVSVTFMHKKTTPETEGKIKELFIEQLRGQLETASKLSEMVKKAEIGSGIVKEM